jgi:hypothetical protein
MSHKELISRNSVFAWIAGATALVLLIPLAAMQVTAEVQWTPIDFAVMALLLFGAGSFYVLSCRVLGSRFHPLIAITFIGLVLYVWAELAVGIFL